MSLNDVFDLAVCINLRRRPDRWAEVSAEFEKHDISATRIDGVYGYLDDVSTDLSPGAFGCKQSHIHALEHGLETGADSMIIFEDDAMFDPDFTPKFDRAIKAIPSDWEMLYLGFNKLDNNFTMLGDGFAQLHGSFSSHAIGLRSRDMIALALRAMRSDAPADVLYGSLHANHKVIGLIPPLVKQRTGFSDIEDVVVDYTWHHGNFGDPIDRV